MLVSAVVRRVLGRRLRARRQHIFEADAGPPGAAGAARGPLVAARRWDELGAAVAAALQHQLIGRLRKALLQLAQRNFYGRVDLAVDDEFPGIGVRRRVEDLAIVPNEVFVGRGDGIVEQVGRRFRHQRLVAEDDEVGRLAWKMELVVLGQRDRHVAAGKRPKGMVAPMATARVASEAPCSTPRRPRISGRHVQHRPCIARGALVPCA